MRKLLKGTPASEGIAAGKSAILPGFETSVPQRTIGENEVQSEIERFHKAREESRHQIQELLEHANIPEEHSGIFEAQILLLDDPMLKEETITRIRELHNPEWALASVIDTYKNILSKSSDSLFRERIADLEDITNRLLSNLLGIHENDIRIPFVKQLKENSILAAEELSPSLLLLIRNKISAIVTEKGGVTDHTAILARDRGIPSIVGVEGLMEKISEGETILVNGYTGEIILSPKKDDLKLFTAYEAEQKKSDGKIKPAVSFSNGEMIRIWTNLGEVEETKDKRLKNTFGVGLFRTEFLYLNNPDLFDSEEEHTELYSEILKELDGKPVTFRMLDIGDDKTFHAPILRHISYNPDAGSLRGVQFLLAYKHILRSQIFAILRAAKKLKFPEENCRIMIPMISSIDEISEFRSEYSQIKKELAISPGRKVFPLGTMVETPAACIMADVISTESDFMSFGTNDLANFTLAQNRTESTPHQEDLFYQPSVIRMMHEAIRKSDKTIAVCGELAGISEMLPVLVGLGIRDISVSFSSAARIFPVLNSIDPERAKELAEKILQARNVNEVKDILKNNPA